MQYANSATFRLSLFLIVSSCKEKFFKNSKSSKLKNSKSSKKCFLYCLNLLRLRSHVDPSYFREINWSPPSDRVEYCIANTFLSTGLELHRDMFMKCLRLKTLQI